jgi:hypothetical protein
MYIHNICDCSPATLTPPTMVGGVRPTEGAPSGPITKVPAKGNLGLLG